jgi:xanthine/CO dehydrogenase XdhC/CoxF family maturation factor
VASRASLKVQISRWENGRTRVSSEDYRALFRHIYRATDEELGFTSEPDDDKIAASLAPVSFHGTWSESFNQAAEEWNIDVERRDFSERAACVLASHHRPFSGF